MKLSLSDVMLRAAKPPASGQITLWDAQLPGFGLRCSQGGTKTFILMHGQERKRTTIGRYPIISLSEARNQAKRILARQTLGRHEPERVMFADAVALYLETKTARPSTLKEASRILNRHFTFNKALGAVTTDDLMGILDRLSNTPSEANHAFKEARTFFRWAQRRRLVNQSPLDGLSMPNREQSRSRVLTDGELKRVWTASEQCGTFGVIVKLLILTGQRRGEIAALQTGWISYVEDRADRVSGHDNSDPSGALVSSVTLPSWITKNNRDHTFPISTLTAQLLRTVVSETFPAILFPARGVKDKSFNGWSKGKATLDKLSGVTDWTLHDLRRTFATGLAALGTPIHVTEKLLNHVSGTTGGLTGIYQRHQWWDEQVGAIHRWEMHLSELLKQS